MKKLIIAAGILFAMTLSAPAQDREFPYQATVVVDEAYVRSGGGDAFYPTQLLARDASVTVLRHDPGGWYMIKPPEGSFSWIPEKYVRPVSRSGGEIIESNVVVFVGSAFGDETHVWQRKMMAEDKVEVIGQRTVDTLTGPKAMLKIKPPAREFRWIQGSALIPVGGAQRVAHDNNPYKVPSEIAQRRPVTRPTDSHRPTDATQPMTTGNIAPSRRLAKLKRIREEQRLLYEIDQKFRGMVLSAPSAWDFQAIETEYLKLQESVTHKPIAGQIDLRYPAINRYRIRKAEIDDLQRLTSATEKRDAQLMASQYGIPQDNFVSNGYSQQALPPGVSMSPPLSSSVVPNSQFESSVATNFEPNTPGSSIDAMPADSKYIGAGFLQRNVGGSETAYLLTSPTGKVLAHLKADDSVDLERYVGRSVGVKGSRWFDDQIKSDYIEVSGLEEVKVRQ